MRTKMFLSSLGVLISTFLFGQIYNPVQWRFSSEQLGSNEYLLIYEAEIESGWAVYSQYLESDLGPVATSINYESSTHFEVVGKAEEKGHRKDGYDAIFDMNVVKFTDRYRIEQRIRLKENKPVTGYLNFMTCDDTKCLPPKDVDFRIELAKASTGKKSPDGSASLPQEENSEPGFEIDLGDEFAEAPLGSDTDGGISDPVAWQASFIKGQPNRVVFIAKIDEGWHIYGQEIEGDGPIPTAFVIEGEKVLLPVEAAYATEEADDFFEGIIIKKIKKEAAFTYSFERSDPIQGEIEFMSCDASKCTFPPPLPFVIDPAKGLVKLGNETFSDEIIETPATYAIDAEQVETPIGACGPAQEVKGKGLWGLFLLGFIGGLFAIVTPCVFPMIPLTVSFFTKGSENRKKGLQRAFLYGGFILLVYLLLSVPFHMLDSVNPGILNEISTNVVLNILFFLIFLFFAFSFFGYYELTLPASWTNKASSAEGVGGAIGIFFMALTLALVSFSCTGPILGTLLAGALTADGGAMQLTAGMGGFGLALALPFAVFAAFPAWLSSIPKSGGWLNTVKVTLGFLELALAFKFLSNADLVKRWGLLKIEPFLVIWIIIFLGLAIYLFGKIRFPHDSPVKKLSFVRISSGILSLAFALYLVSGFRVNKETNTFQSLTVLSGLAPPSGYSWFFPNDCPNDLDCFKDLDKGIAHAKKVNKPVMIDFTGHACVNCRKMEEHVWPQSPVIDRLKEDFVLISLYVDEKITLPEEDQIVVQKKSGNKQKLRTYGNKWEHFQSEYFNNNSQPYYVLLSPDGKLLNQPVGYTPDVEEYASFLDCGLDVFKELQSEIGLK